MALDPGSSRATHRQDPVTSEVGGAPLAVLGAGSWGTALAIQFARSGRPTRLWGRDRARLAAMARERRNDRYLDSGSLPQALTVEPELAAALRGACDVLVAVPSHAFRSV